MSNRSRIIAFSSAALFVVAGAFAAATIGGVIGAVLAFVLISLGLVLATSLAFLEVGLSEDRELEREYKLRVRAERRALAARSRRPSLRRERAHPRTLD